MLFSAPNTIYAAPAPRLLWSELSECQQYQLAATLSCSHDVALRDPGDPEAHARLASLLIRELSPGLRSALVLRDLKNWDYASIARVMGISEMNVRVRVHRARTEVQKRYRDRLLV